MLDVGHKLGPYVIVAPLGSGGMGEVYRARDPRLGREVAVKVLSSIDANEESRWRFEREARAVAALSHPNVLAIFDVGLEEPPFLVTELLEGETLHARLSRGQLHGREILAIADQLVAGVAAVHERGMIHRDLKPPNVFITRDGLVKVLDFGLSRAAARGAPLLGDADQATRTGAVMGTPSYMAPEQVRGLETDARTDVFALGVIMHEMATGERPFRGPSAADIMVSVLVAAPEGTVVRSDLPPDFASVVRRCLEKAPEARFDSAVELRRALERLGGGSPIVESAAYPVAEATAITATMTFGAPHLASIAVLPFVDRSADGSLAHFCEGMADEISTALGSIEGVRVASRSAASRARRDGLDAIESGKRLNVSSVVEGAVQTAGSRMRVTAQLSSVGDGYQIWSRRFDRDIENIFAIQDDIGRAIVESLEVRRGPEVTTPNASGPRRQTASADAYQLYLEGRHHLARRSKGSVSAALRAFERAIALDDTYALAHAATSECYTMLGAYGVRSGAEMLPLAKAAAERALALDDTLAETHAAMGSVKTFLEWDRDGADRALSLALERAPRLATAIATRGLNLSHSADFVSGCALALRAVDLDPDSAHVAWLAAVPHVYARRHERALTLLDRAIALDETAIPAWWIKAWALAALGRFAEAIDAADRAAQASNRQSVFLSTLGFALGAAGRRADARAVLDELLAQRAAGEYVAPLHIADVHAGLGDRDAAIAALEEASIDRNGFLVATAVTPLHDALRTEPRYLAFVASRRVAWNADQ